MKRSRADNLKRLRRALMLLTVVLSAILVAAGPSSAGAQSQTAAQPQATSAGLVMADAQLVAPAIGSRVANLGPLMLRWTSTEAATGDWEVQVSGDGRFDLDPATATSPVQTGMVREPAWPLAAVEPCRAYFWRVRLTMADGSAPGAWSPTWSFSSPGSGPVASKIAFIYHYQGVPVGERPPSYDELYVMNADGTGRTPLAMADRYAPSWSPDGCIAFSRGDTLYTIAAAGGDPSLLAAAQGGFFGKTAWSPDGTRLAFAHAPAPSGPSEIYVANADGTGMTQLTSCSGCDAPAWSPNGQRIVFHGAEPGAAFTNLFVMSADGSGLVRLNTAATAQVPGGDAEPVVSPDGIKVAFSSGRSGIVGVYVMNVDGTGLTALAAQENSDNPAWSADGAQLLYHSTRGGQHGGAVWAMDADGKNQRQISSLAALAVTLIEEGDSLPAPSR